MEVPSHEARCTHEDAESRDQLRRLRSPCPTYGAVIRTSRTILRSRATSHNISRHGRGHRAARPSWLRRV